MNLVIVFGIGDALFQNVD